jgi:hypothetical protein
METPSDIFDPEHVMPPDPRREALFADKTIASRVDGDFGLVHDAILEANACGEPLDKDFIQEVAAKRLAHAQANYTCTNGPDAGPTLETSTRIVASIVGLHQVFPVLLEQTTGGS